MNRRGAASIAALALAAVVGTAATQMAALVRAAERRSSEQLQNTAARAQILVRAMEESTRFPNEETAHASDFSEKVGDSSLLVRVTWRRAGGRWRVLSWMEVRSWPEK